MADGRHLNGPWNRAEDMPFIMANGVLILIPAALYLAVLASRGEFGTAFYGAQAIELFAGAINIGLMSLNISAGLRLTGRLKSRILT